MYQDYTTPDTVNVGSFANPKTSGMQENQNQVKKKQHLWQKTTIHKQCGRFRNVSRTNHQVLFIQRDHFVSIGLRKTQ